MFSETPKIKLKKDFQIVVLVCLLLDELGALTDNQLIEIVTLDEMTDIFSVSHAFRIIEEKSLANTGDSGGTVVYSPNNNGKLLVKEFISRIPLSVREKCINEGKRILRITELRRSLDWSVQKKECGYEFKIKFFNEITGAVLMELKMYSTTLESAKDMEKRFLEKPSEIVEKIFNSFISDNDVIFFKD